MINGSKNRGDWGEFYVLIYLLGQGKLFASDNSLNKIDSSYFSIKNIYRTESDNNHVIFSIPDSNKVKILINDMFEKNITQEEFVREANLLLKDIPAGSNSFTIPHGEAFLNNLGCKKLAASSRDITDIKMRIHDFQTGLDQDMGFSIKSYFGGPPTLLNASGATNFIYNVTGVTKEEAQTINAINSRAMIQDRISAIKDCGGSLTFSNLESDTFSNNLLLIDSKMETLLSHILKYSYENNETDCKIVLERIEQKNPLNYPRYGIYTHKFKDFLCAKALGMDPGRPWNGTDDANGGYIVAKPDGEVVAFHIHNRDTFKEYLLENTVFERASTKRHNFASIYSEREKLLIKLNMQIRFKKLMS